MNRNVKAVGVPWFTAESWPRLLAIASDRRRLPHTFAEFEHRASATFEAMRAQGSPVEKVLIDIDQLVAYCEAAGRSVNAFTRAEFAALAVARRHEMH